MAARTAAVALVDGRADGHFDAAGLGVGRLRQRHGPAARLLAVALGARAPDQRIVRNRHVRTGLRVQKPIKKWIMRSVNDMKKVLKTRQK